MNSINTYIIYIFFCLVIIFPLTTYSTPNDSLPEGPQEKRIMDDEKLKGYLENPRYEYDRNPDTKTLWEKFLEWVLSFFDFELDPTTRKYLGLT
ncbi:MAG: hypothetical protein ABEH43_00100, partial [Flavobacteriales bacterium]